MRYTAHHIKDQAEARFWARQTRLVIPIGSWIVCDHEDHPGGFMIYGPVPDRRTAEAGIRKLAAFHGGRAIKDRPKKPERKAR